MLFVGNKDCVEDVVPVVGGAERPSAAMTGSLTTAAAAGVVVGAPLTGLGVGSRPHRDFRFRSLGCADVAAADADC